MAHSASAWRATRR